MLDHLYEIQKLSPAWLKYLFEKTFNDDKKASVIDRRNCVFSISMEWVSHMEASDPKN